MNKIPMLEKFAAQSLVDYDGELIFSKEKFAELIVRECANVAGCNGHVSGFSLGDSLKEHFGVKLFENYN